MHTPSDHQTTPPIALLSSFLFSKRRNDIPLTKCFFFLVTAVSRSAEPVVDDLAFALDSKEMEASVQFERDLQRELERSVMVETSDGDREEPLDASLLPGLSAWASGRRASDEHEDSF